MIDQKKKQIVEYIAKTYVDPRTHLPHPPLRIEDFQISMELLNEVFQQFHLLVLQHFSEDQSMKSDVFSMLESLARRLICI